MLKIKDKKNCRWDFISLGEVLLRFDSGDERIHTTQNFRVFDGGGEYNVARNLAKTFRQRTAIVTALADNSLGRLAENLIHAGNVDASEILWRDLKAVKIAKENGVIVSYDLNYLSSLWKNRGGKVAANELNREFLPFADVVFGVMSGEFKPSVTEFDEQKFQKAAKKMQADFPNLQIIVSTLRDTHNASSHNFSATCFADNRVIVADKYIKTNVLDRVGSGDAFVSGFIYGLLNEKDLKFSINCGTAHGVLVMTTIGDNSTATVEEIEHLMRGDSSAAKR